MSGAEDLELARMEAIVRVSGVLSGVLSEGADEPVADVAERVVDDLLLSRPDLVQRLAYPPPRRCWVSVADRRSTLPRLFRGGDEFGNATLALRLGARLFVLALDVPLKRWLAAPFGVFPDPEPRSF